ncbi:tricorn protease [Oceaniferula spumae]|uniref:Tricorn protease homolog n=1 Tax=Oceaniferula spumae TaxID=2979115 RepID=A0AAT9FGV9_9BACT
MFPRLATLLSPFFLSALLTIAAHAAQPIRMAYYPDISPDGSTIVFSWQDDIWSASVEGGEARRLTTHPARDFAPRFTTDGKSICFGSMREGNYQAFIMSSSGGAARQLTFHSEGAILQDISPDGKSILVQGIRDNYGARPYRLFQVGIDGKSPEKEIFDAHAQNGRYSADGKSVIFTREGAPRYRKGYHGTQASQVWTWKTNKDGQDVFEQPVSNEFGCRNPVFDLKGNGFYYTCGSPNGFNLWYYNNADNSNKQITFFDDDSVMQPAISRDGSTMIFRHLFDLYVLPLTTSDSDQPAEPKKLKLWHNEDLDMDEPHEMVIKKTSDVTFSPSGLETIFTARGDLWAMDTILKKPNRLTSTPGHEKDVWFSHDGKSVLYIHDDGINTEIRRLVKTNPNKYWWEAKQCKHTVIVKAESRPTSVIPSPDGKKIAYTTFPGNLWVCEADGSKPARILESWDMPNVKWSPDGKWIAYAVQDDDFNSDIYIVAADGASAPVNISRHPDNDFSPAWSPDGRRLAFVGRHHKENYDLFYVDLYRSDEAKDTDGETRERARKAMEKDPSYKDTAKKVVKKAIETLTKDKKKPEEEETFDFKNISQRINRLEVKGATPLRVIWNSDSKKILFQSRSGKTTYAIEAKPGGKTSKFAEATGVPIRMDSRGRLFWLSDGVPAVLASGKNVKYPFTIYTYRDPENWKRMTFRTAWNVMRDQFYDPSMNNRDWNKVREKYEDMAATAPTSLVFDRIANMMLGELNASHMGFRSPTWPEPWKPRALWKEETVHFGVRFDADHEGKGWRVSSVIPNSPATRSISEISPGELITKVGYEEVSSDTPLTDVLNRRLSDPVWLTVEDAQGEERQVKVQPISYAAARNLVKDAQIDETEAAVDKLSGGKLGYIHVARMMWDEFEQFEHHLYEQGAGKKGIVIDVRDNGGGFTSDHLLTALCQPRHAFTIPRNGGVGYPQDRIVYATWNKPIIVLCNQNSFSNAEIFAHAIRNLDRGKIVGVATAGGVISTGSANIMGATMRLPFRGWFSSATGQDMELNGAEPHFVIWNKPGELSAGIDHQLEKAVTVLLAEADQAKSGPRAHYRSHSDEKKPSQPETPGTPTVNQPVPGKSTDTEKTTN